MVGPRQDRQGVRSPAELERKYAFGAVFRQQGQENSRLLESVSRVSQSQSQSDARFSGLVSGLRQDVEGQKQGLEAVTRRLSQAEGALSGNDAAIGQLRTTLASAQCTEPFFGIFYCINHRLFHRNRNSVVINYMNFSVIFLGKNLGTLTGSAESAGHRNIHNLVISL